MQSVARATKVLRAITEAQDEDGWTRGAEIAEATGLHRGTVHRFLRAWVYEGWVEHDEKSRRYRIGLSLLALSATAAGKNRFLSVARSAVAALAEKTGDTAYLFQHAGLDGVCMERQAGSHPIQYLATHVGNRVPLGRMAGTIAILSALDERTAAYIIDENISRNDVFAQAGRRYYLDAVDTARRQGYAETEGTLIPGIRGFGVPLMVGNQVAGGLSLAVMKDRLEGDHRTVVLKALKEQAAQVRRIMNPGNERETVRKAV
ncbi:MAG: IclR family transcriptional regulator [Pseudomonadota bacterium]|nr:MAG: IclR family transcriptional regulator [Pseudomonadota bacterium]